MHRFGTIRYWLAILLVVLAAVFIGQNRARQQVHVLWITVESPMWLLLTAMLVVGIVVGLLLHRPAAATDVPESSKVVRPEPMDSAT